MAGPNIVLVGFMGTGKTTAGRAVAERLGREHLDTDDLIEVAEGMPIPEIFDKKGETGFRAVERQVVREVSGRSDLVITAGGGVVLNSDNMSDFSRSGVVICLTASWEKILQRVSDEAHRPLLEQGEKASRIRKLLTERQPLYNAIELQVDTDELDPAGVVDRILELFEENGP